MKAKHAARLAQQENLADRVEALRQTLEKLRRRTDLLNLEERQLLLRELGVRVVAYPDRSL
jgi:ribosomal protein L19E